MSDRTKARHLETIDPVILNNRRIVIEALESGKHRQAISTYGCWYIQGAPVCWGGLVLRLFCNGESVSAVHGHEEDAICRVLGIDIDTMGTFMSANDEGVKFPDLALMMKAML